MQDILLDNNLDLLIANGDFVIGHSDAQQQQLLLIAGKGSFKEFPTTGVGVSDFVEAEDPASLLKEIRTQFYQDGMTIQELSYDGTNLKIDASY